MVLEKFELRAGKTALQETVPATKFEDLSLSPGPTQGRRKAAPTGYL